MDKVVDFELTIRGGPGAYTAEVSIDGGADTTFQAGPVQLQFNIHQLQVDFAARWSEYGRELTRVLFAPDEIRDAFATARGMASAQRTSLRFRLALGAGADELQPLHWELLYLPGRDERLCTREDIIFSRYVPVGASAAPPAPKTTLRALAAIASPSNVEAYQLAKIDLPYEIERARAGLSDMQVDWLPSAQQHCTLDSLGAGIPGHDVLYLVCHGSVKNGEGWLMLEDNDGRAEHISARQLAQRLAGTLSLPRLAVLVACESAGNEKSAFFGSLAPRLLEAGIPAVIGMQSSLSFATSNLFLPPLFRELQKDGRIDRAVSVARRSILGRPDEFAPVLFMGLKSGLLWSIPQPVPPAADVPAAPARSAPTAAAGQAVDQVRLYQILSGDAFSMEDLEGICFGLNIDWEMLRGGVKTAKARAMIQYFQSRGRLAELIEAIRSERPHLGL